MVQVDHKEDWDFNGCHVWMNRKNSKIILCLENNKPYAQVIMAFFVSKYGEPTDYCIIDEENSNESLFAFNDNSKQELVDEWNKVFREIPNHKGKL